MLCIVAADCVRFDFAYCEESKAANSAKPDCPAISAFGLAKSYPHSPIGLQRTISWHSVHGRWDPSQVGGLDFSPDFGSEVIFSIKAGERK